MTQNEWTCTGRVDMQCSEIFSTAPKQILLMKKQGNVLHSDARSPRAAGSGRK